IMLPVSSSEKGSDPRRRTENVQVSPRAHAGPHGSSIPRRAHVHPRRPGNRPAREASEREGGERVRRTRPRLGPFLGKPRRREHPGGPRGEPRRATVLPRSGSARLLGAPGGPGSRPDREQGRRPRSVGNITIAERDHEVDRLVEKTRAGCDFFTTQVLFEAEPMATVLRAYGRRCSSQNLKPATVLLSFAPVSDYQDIEFLVWLGATVS